MADRTRIRELAARLNAAAEIAQKELHGVEEFLIGSGVGLDVEVTSEEKTASLRFDKRRLMIYECHWSEATRGDKISASWLIKDLLETVAYQLEQHVEVYCETKVPTIDIQAR